MKQKIAVYQGTFDPFTSGHLHILQAARGMFDEVVVLLLDNPVKRPLFSVQERTEMIVQTIQETSLSGVRVESDGGLLADYMRRHELIYCVRGVRNARDADFEMENHRLSRIFYPSLQTILIPCEASFSLVSSSSLKAACSVGRMPAAWAPLCVRKRLEKKYPSLVFF